MKSSFKPTHVVSIGDTTAFSIVLASIIALIHLTHGAGTARAQFTRLHAFGGSPNDGATPWWDSSLASDGSTLYGVTQLGGVFLGNTQGTLCSFDLTGNGGNGDGCGGGGGGDPELSGTLSKVKDSCKTKDEVTTCKLSAGLAVLNSGNGDAPATHIRHFLSTDANYDDGVDTLLGESTTKVIKDGKDGKGKLKAVTGASSTGQYILAVDDDDEVLASLQAPAI